MSEQKAPGQNSKLETLAILEQQRREITAKIDAERAEALAEIVSTARAGAELVGVSIDELTKAIQRWKPAGKQAAEPAAAKYRNPENHAETWNGKGRKPAWLAVLLNDGKTLEDFTINE